jgi:hypothetical protein
MPGGMFLLRRSGARASAVSILQHVNSARHDSVSLQSSNAELWHVIVIAICITCHNSQECLENVKKFYILICIVKVSKVVPVLT